MFHRSGVWPISDTPSHPEKKRVLYRLFQGIRAIQATNTSLFYACNNANSHRVVSVHNAGVIIKHHFYPCFLITTVFRAEVLLIHIQCHI